MYKEIPIDEIRPAKNPIRQFRDNEKIRELAQSIKEKGVLQPIKVRPVPFDGTTKYEIVYGARRWEAASLAGLETIPANIDEVEDSDSIVEGLIENIQRDDMLDIDIAISINTYLSEKIALMQKNNTNTSKFFEAKIKRELACIMGWKSESYVTRYLMMLSPKRKPIVDEFYKANSDAKDVKTKAEWLQRAMPDEDIEIQKAVARLAVEEDLGQRRVKEVAQAVAQAKTPEEKESILESSYEEIVNKPSFIKAKAQQKRKAKKQKIKKQKELSRSVATYLEAAKTFNDAIKEAILAAEYGNFSPEGKTFTINRHKIIIENIQKLEDILNVK